ncbi:MAG: hypothetical protein KKH94_01265, partial [Candidatus Omnitrophica bacterium]|nr:hypothetical protein [Candidatus Omnitrophota bacterium]
HLRDVYESMQKPQYDVITIGNPNGSWSYDVEGPDRHRPEECDPTVQFNWVNPDIHKELPVIAKVFTPRDNNFAIRIKARTAMQ